VKLDTLLLTCSVICKLVHKVAFWGHPVGASGAIEALYLKVLTQRHFVAEFHRENSVLLVKKRISVSEPPFGRRGLRVTYAIHL